jgi:guanine deaminase
MDRHAAPDYQESSAAESLEATTELIAYIRSLQPHGETALVHPILTPRFALCCTNNLLTGLGKLAASDSTLAIQTHIAENQGEITMTRKLFPECSSYADVYDHYGLLSERTILAHGCLLDDGEFDLIRKRNAGISHCPTSNFNLRSGVAKVGEMLDRGIKVRALTNVKLGLNHSFNTLFQVGLGTDVSGGFSPSILTEVRHASIASKVLAFQSPPKPVNLEGPPKFAGSQLPISALLHMATLGGAFLCNLESQIGNFLPGKQFDALLVSLTDENGNPGTWWRSGETKYDTLLERFLFCGDDRNIKSVWVKGRSLLQS